MVIEKIFINWIYTLGIFELCISGGTVANCLQALKLHSKSLARPRFALPLFNAGRMVGLGQMTKKCLHD